MNFFRTQIVIEPPELTEQEQAADCLRRRKEIQAKLNEKMADIAAAVRLKQTEESRWRSIKRALDAIDHEIYAFKLKGLLP
jgi:hypothetical protein